MAEPTASQRTQAESTAATLTAAQTSTPEPNRRWTLQRVVILSAGGLIAFIVLVFVVGLIMALADAPFWSSRVQIFRDLVLMILAVQGILIIASIAILIIQIARFVNLLRSEVKPIAEDTRTAVKNVRTTTEFVGRHTTEPLMTLRSFTVGLFVFLKEMLRITRLIRRKKDQPQEVPGD